MTVILKTLLIVILAVVQTEPVEQQDITVKHTVQPGESLHSITRSYLGTDILWQDNWRLNPHIENPNQLKIGEELTVIEQRIIPAEKAKVLDVVNRVEKKPAVGDWLSAANGDELIQQEGVRTYEKSSALLEFNDESKLKVLEFSQIFLQSRKTALTGTDSATIEVIKGDAELSWEPLVNDQTEITIVTGGTVSKPQAASGQVAELRTGLTEAGNSVISVYQGNSAVASAGSAVNVKQGMGLAVKPGEVPPAPKPLLKAPKISDELDHKYSYTNPIVSWQKVAGAQSYLLEICQDVGCDSVLQQQSLQTHSSQLSDFNTPGTYYLRIAAVSDDEIVGFRSATHALEFTDMIDDINPPMIAIEISGPKEINQAGLVVGPEAEVMLYAYDELSGVESISYGWGGSEWHLYDEQPIKIPNEGAILKVQAVDGLGQNTTKSYHFIIE